MSGVKYNNSKKDSVIGWGKSVKVPIEPDLHDPKTYEGAVVYGEDGNIWFSNGTEWKTTSEDLIRKPQAVEPSTPREQAQLTLTGFAAAQGSGLHQAVVTFELYNSLEEFTVNQKIISATWSAGTATITLSKEHDLTVYDTYWAQISNVKSSTFLNPTVDEGYNTTRVEVTAVTPTQFTYDVALDPGTYSPSRNAKLSLLPRTKFNILDDVLLKDLDEDFEYTTVTPPVDLPAVLPEGYNVEFPNKYDLTLYYFDVTETARDNFGANTKFYWRGRYESQPGNKQVSAWSDIYEQNFPKLIEKPELENVGSTKNPLFKKAIILKPFQTAFSNEITMGVGGGTTWRISLELENVEIENASGQFTCDTANLVVDQQVTISGTNGGTGSVTNGTYKISDVEVVNADTTRFTLVTLDNDPITTSTGTPVGLTITAKMDDQSVPYDDVYLEKYRYFNLYDAIYDLEDGKTYHFQAQFKSIELIESEFSDVIKYKIPERVGIVLKYDVSKISGPTNTKVVTLSLKPVSPGEGVTIKWGDGSPDTDILQTVPLQKYTHTYDGTTSTFYTIRILGDVEIFGSNASDTDVRASNVGLIEVLALGEEGLKSLSRAFEATTNLAVVASSIPSTVENLSYTFYQSGFGGTGKNSDPNGFTEPLYQWDVSNVTDMSFMFFGATSFNSYINGFDPTTGFGWDVSSVTDMRSMFYNAHAFNIPLDGWDVSSVTDMTSMFFGARAFNQDLGTWKLTSIEVMVEMFWRATKFNNGKTTGGPPIPLTWILGPNLTDMSNMFYEATSFNQDVSSWTVEYVTSMASMFQYATSFNQDVSGWDVSSVTDMASMFQNATSFNNDNQPLVWDVSNVINMSYMFSGATSFNQPVTFSLDSVTDMSNMFYEATSFNQTVTFNNLDNVIDMGYMFEGAKAFNSNINLDLDVNTGSGIDMNHMFKNAIAFNQSITAWDVSNVTDMGYMFEGAKAFNSPIWDIPATPLNIVGMFKKAEAFNQDISSWDVSQIDNFTELFFGAFNFNQDISSWLLSANDIDMTSMFQDARGFNRPLTWDVSKVKYMRGMFAGTPTNLDSLDNQTVDWPTPNAQGTINGSIKTVFNQDISDWDVSNVTDMSYMFYHSSFNNNNINLNLSGDFKNTLNNVTTMKGMFAFNTYTKPSGNWELKGIQDMSYMFYASTFNSNLPASANWNSNFPLGGCENTSYMFAYNKDFDHVTIISMPTTNVTNMAGMFREASEFKRNITGWDVSNVMNMEYMFYNADKWALQDDSLVSWDVSRVTNMSYMFGNIDYNNSGITSWDTGNVVYMKGMFYKNTTFDQSLANWNIGSLIDADLMLDDTVISAPNYTDTLIKWANQAPGIQQNVKLGAKNRKYFTGATASRNTLTSPPYSWTITDGGPI